MNSSPGVLHRWILMGSTLLVNGVFVVLTVLLKMMSGSMMKL